MKISALNNQTFSSNLNEPIAMGKLDPGEAEVRAKSDTFKKFTDGVADVRKGLVYAQYTPGGVAKSVATGLAVGTAAFGGFWTLARVAKNGNMDKSVIKSIGDGLAGAGKSVGKSITEMFTHFAMAMGSLFKPVGDAFKGLAKTSSVGKAAKFATVGIGLGAAIYSLVRTKLNINDATAPIDHRFNAGHRARTEI